MDDRESVPANRPSLELQLLPRIAVVMRVKRFRFSAHVALALELAGFFRKHHQAP